jgi:tetratricopeptide (TPR) repeat protein
MMEKSRLRIVAAAIFLGAFAARLIYLLQVKDLPIYYQPVLDTGFFHRWAEYKQQVSWLEAVPPFREAFYAYFLALVYSGLRESLNLARVIQCLLGGLTALLVFSIGRRIYGLAAGVMGGVLFALCVPAVFFALELNEVTLTLLLLSAGAYLLVRAYDERPYLNSLLSGLTLGAAFLSSFWAIGALPAWLAGGLSYPSSRARKAVLAMLVGFAIAPLCYQLILVRSDQKTIFPLRASWQAFLGSGATGGTASRAWYEISVASPTGAYHAIASPDRIEGQRDAMRFAAIEDSAVTTPAEAHAHWQKRVVEDFAADPLRSLKIYVTKLGMFWGRSEPPSNLDMRFLSQYSFVLRTRVFSFGVIAALGLVGLAAGVRRRAAHLAVFVPLTSVIAAFFLISDEAKVLVTPFLCVFAGYLTAEVIAGFRKAGTVRAALLIVAAAVVGMLVYLLPARNVDRVENLVAVGDVYGEVAVFDKAEELYKEAMAMDPSRPEPYFSLARLYGNTGKAQAGVELLNTAVGLGVDDPRVGIERGSLLIMAGQYDEALSGLEKVEGSYPYEPRLHQLIGLSFLDMGLADTARDELRKELDYVGGGFITYSALGRAEFELQDYEDAARYLESALSFNPYNASASVQLADTYSKMGQYLKACDILGKILAVDPGNIPIRFKLANYLFRADRPQDALRHFKDLYKYDPRNADILVNMGTVYADMDSLDMAIEVWKRALVLDPGNEMARDNLKLAEEQHD